MEEQLISFETAKLAKEKGCNLENCTCGGYPDCICYDKRISQSLLAKWLREKHGIDILVQRDFSNGIKKYILTPCFDKPIPKGYESVEKNNYEEAYEIGLQEALKLIK